ncbi:MAG: penicillin acylase family protein, partial [Planctomycetota bacterium]
MSRIRLKTPDGLKLSRDPYGIPQIDAADLERLHWGMGACHALDRGLQMQLMRILGKGRAAELLEDSEAMVEVDRFFLRMNWRGGCAAEAGRLQERTRELCEQYVRGINAAFEHRWPWELRLLRIEREPWTVADLILISRMTGYLTLAQSQGEIERFFVELVQAGVDDARLEALFPFATSEIDRELLSKVKLGERIVPEALKWLSPAPRAMASNNWVVAASRTASGKPLMANDPHLETNRLPAVWVEQSYRWPGGWGLFAGMPGLPAALVGRSQSVAWGATYTFMDALDSWVEECRDGAYKREGEWKPFHVRTETIVRKKHPGVQVRFYENEHGVLDGDPTEAGFYLATRWAPGDSGAMTLDAAAEAWNVSTVEEGRRVLGRIETAWNWVFADADGHIGYQMSGRLPRRTPGVSGFVPRDGSNPAFDWQGWVPIEELPRCMDPEAGYIITANQDLNHFGTV